MNTEFEERNLAIEHLTVEYSEVREAYEHLKTKYESGEQGVTDFHKAIEDVELRYKAKISQLLRENTDYKHKFVLYCKELEIRLGKEFNVERSTLERRIVGLRHENDKLTEEF